MRYLGNKTKLLPFIDSYYTKIKKHLIIAVMKLTNEEIQKLKNS